MSYTSLVENSMGCRHTPRDQGEAALRRERMVEATQACNRLLDDLMQMVDHCEWDKAGAQATRVAAAAYDCAGIEAER